MNSDSTDEPTDAPERTDHPGFLSSERELDAARAEIHSFLERTITGAGARGVVVAMSGGIDSTLTATLAAEALGSDRVLGLGLPTRKTPDCHMADARTIADGLGIEFREIQLRPLLDMFEDTAAASIDPRNGTEALGNVAARLRMICSYYAANTRSRLVCGTANRSELLLGYVTKYGDGGADLFPLGDLYKTEVRALAQTVGIPRRIIEREPTAGLRRGQTDAADLGATYDSIDPLLYRVVDRGEDVDDAAEELCISSETARHVATLHTETHHKRTVPPTTGIRTQTGDRRTRSSHAPNSDHTDGEPASHDRLDELYSILANELCRHVIRFFDERHADLASLEELQDYLHATAEGELVTEARSLRVVLSHSVLPKMADAGLLEFDQRSDSIRYYGHPVIESQMEHVLR